MEIKKAAVARLDGQTGEIATAFLIAPEYVITAKHTFLNRDVKNYTIRFPNVDPETPYSIVKIDFEEDIGTDNLANDIAILKLNVPINHIKPLALNFSFITGIEIWKSYGFPGSKRTFGEMFEGTIHDHLSENLSVNYDLSLYCKKPQIIDGRYGLEGASGAPIIHNDKVVAVFSFLFPGSIVGAATLKRSRNFLEKYIPILDEESEETPLQKEIKSAISNTARFIEGFPDELQEFLSAELTELQQQFLDDLDDIKFFLKNSKYPIANEETLVGGIEATFEIILLIKSMYGNIQFLKEDDFANIRVKSEVDFNMSFVYAQKRNQAMPEILLEMHNQMINKSAAQIMIEIQKPIPPYPVIFDNCSGSNKHNLCKCCGQSFEFQGILKSFIESEDDGLFKGIEKNNFELLNKVKVICAECVRKVRNFVETKDDLERLVGEKIYG